VLDKKPDCEPGRIHVWSNTVPRNRSAVTAAKRCDAIVPGPGTASTNSLLRRVLCLSKVHGERQRRFSARRTPSCGWAVNGPESGTGGNQPQEQRSPGRFPSFWCDHRCPTPSGRIGAMRLKHVLESLRPREEVVATFGEAQLIRGQDGKCELRGGTPGDRQEAKEWILMFWHEANVRGLE